MSYLLDTCVLSELVRPRPEQKVLQWLNSAQDCYVSALTIGELQRGIEMAADDIRRHRLTNWLQDKVLRQFADRTLAVDVAVARAWGRLHGKLQRQGHNLPSVDGLLAATAAVYKLTLVTRNEKDFAATGLPLLNPWQ